MSDKFLEGLTQLKSCLLIGLTLLRGIRRINLIGQSFLARFPRGFRGFDSVSFRALAHTNANGATRGHGLLHDWLGGSAMGIYLTGLDACLVHSIATAVLANLVEEGFV